MHFSRFIRVVLVLIGIIAITASCTKQQNQEAVVVDQVASATDYTQIVSSAVPVQTKALRDKVVGSGTIQGQQEVSVKARTSGEIKAIQVALGGTLKKGDVLIELDDKVANLTLSQLEKQSENAQKELAVNEQLYAKGAISLSALNLSRSAADGLSAQLQNARNNLSHMSITTPIDGSVAEVSKLVVGDLLLFGTQVARIVDLAHLRVALSIGQSQLFLIKEGATADVVIATPTENITAPGKVSAISASSDSRTGSWTVYVDFDNPRPDRIKAGITA
jgi:membrane fusion protein (multidrug efflux system)